MAGKRKGGEGRGGEDDQDREERAGWREGGGWERERGIRGKRARDFQEIAIQIKFFTFSRHYRSLVH